MVEMKKLPVAGARRSSSRRVAYRRSMSTVSSCSGTRRDLPNLLLRTVISAASKSTCSRDKAMASPTLRPATASRLMRAWQVAASSGRLRVPAAWMSAAISSRENRYGVTRFRGGRQQRHGRDLASGVECLEVAGEAADDRQPALVPDRRGAGGWVAQATAASIVTVLAPAPSR